MLVQLFVMRDKGETIFYQTNWYTCKQQRSFLTHTLVSFVPFPLEAWNLFFIPSKPQIGTRNAQAKRLKSLQNLMCIPVWMCFFCLTSERFGGRELGTWNPRAAEGAKGAQPWTTCTQVPGAKGTFFSVSVMSILSLLVISQSLPGCQIYCWCKFGFLMVELVTLTISHDHFIEMKPKVTLWLVGSSEWKISCWWQSSALLLMAPVLENERLWSWHEGFSSFFLYSAMANSHARTSCMSLWP